MNHYRQLSLFLASLCIASTAGAVAPYYSIRSQSVDAARELVGCAHKINLFDMEKLYGAFHVTLEGTGSFKPNRISQCLFGVGDTCCSTPGTCNTTFTTSSCYTTTLATCNTCCDGVQIGISGSQVANRAATDWLADYFGLSPSFQGTIGFKPRVNNFIADFNLYLGLDEWLCGAYFRIHAPVVWTKWNLHACETIITTTTLVGYAAGYFGPSAVPASSLVQSPLAFFQNQAVPTIGSGVTFQPLSHARFACGGLTHTALAEIQMALGWNFFLDENYHFGFNFRAYAPTGNRPEGLYLFEPIVGNGKSWEVGAGLTTHYTFWRSEDEDCSFGLYVDANLTTLLRTRQTRTFDLVGRSLSRYMLAEQLGTPVTNLYANILPGDQAGSTAPSAQFQNIFTPVANLTTVDVKVSSALQADVVAMFNYTNCNFEFDFGYDFWARTCEKIDLDCDCNNVTALAGGTTWALKGDASVYGYAQISAGEATAGQAIPLSATESNATINTGTNGYPNGIGGVIPQRNPGVDNPAYARLVAAATANANIVYFPGGVAADQIETSLNPVFITEVDLALNSARTQGMSQKVFAHFSYTWRDNDCYLPFLGVGGKAEFASGQSCGSGSNNGCCSTGCNTNVNCNPIASGGLPACPPFIDNDGCGSCQRCNLSEWGVWIKGGVAF